MWLLVRSVEVEDPGMGITESFLLGVTFDQRLHSMFTLSVKTGGNQWCPIFVASALLAMVFGTAAPGDEAPATALDKSLNEVETGL